MPESPVELAIPTRVARSGVVRERPMATDQGDEFGFTLAESARLMPVAERFGKC